jgi:ArsR family transcriptional regulator
MVIPLDLPNATIETVAPRSTLDEGEAATYAAWFRALGDPTRIRILHLLAQSPEPVCFCDIADQFPLGQSTISHHVKVLRGASLINTERRGTFMHYHVNQECVAQLPEAMRRILQGEGGR